VIAPAPASTPSAPAAAPAPRRRRPAALQHIGSRYAILLVWAALAAVYGATDTSNFMSIASLQAIFNGQQPLVFMAAALMSTIIVGEFVDLSVPSVFGFSATLVPVLAVSHHWPAWAAMVTAVAAAAAVGAVQGYLVVKVHVNTIVVTLGMGTLLTGIGIWMTNDNTISGLPTGLAKVANLDLGGLPISFYYGVVLIAGFAYLLWFTPLGRHMRFVGASREVSRLSGVRVDRIRFGSFVVAGLLSGVGAVIAVAGFGGYNPTSSDTYLPQVFAVVFLGTAMIEPGRFNPIGTFIGIYFLETGIFGLQLLQLQNWVTNVFYGGVLVVAVTISTLLRRRAT
jgi:ribose transport system permease protein